MIAWVIATGSFWGAIVLLVTLAIVDAVCSAREAREARRDALRRIPIVRKRGRASRGSAPVQPEQRTPISTQTR